jgi:hypothetical protein
MQPEPPASAAEADRRPNPGFPQLLRRVPPSVYGGLVMAIIGALGWASGVPWLFPSLGPTIAIQSEAPEHPAARPWSVVVGHLIGAAVGFAAVRLTGVIHERPVNVSHVLTLAPAAATTLLIVVGALDADLHGAFVLAAGIVLVAILGEGVRRLKHAAAVA